MIAQARLGPGRIHHCMRAIGAAERALEAMCARAVSRITFGQPIATRGNIQDWIAESRIEIEMARLLTLKAAWLMDTVGNRHARTEIAAIKVAAPNVALKVIDRAIQVHGGGGVSDDFHARLGLRPPAHAAPRRRPRRGPQALDRPPRARALHPARGVSAARRRRLRAGRENQVRLGWPLKRRPRWVGQSPAREPSRPAGRTGRRRCSVSSATRAGRASPRDRSGSWSSR